MLIEAIVACRPWNFSSNGPSHFLLTPIANEIRATTFTSETENLPHKFNSSPISSSPIHLKQIKALQISSWSYNNHVCKSVCDILTDGLTDMMLKPGFSQLLKRSPNRTKRPYLKTWVFGQWTFLFQHWPNTFSTVCIGKDSGLFRIPFYWNSSCMEFTKKKKDF